MLLFMMEKILKCINIYHIPWKVQIIYISHRKYENKVLILSNLHLWPKCIVACFWWNFYPYTRKGANGFVHESTGSQSVPWVFIKHYTSSSFWPREMHVKYILISFSPWNSMIMKVLPTWLHIILCYTKGEQKL